MHLLSHLAARDPGPAPKNKILVIFLVIFLNFTCFCICPGWCPCPYRNPWNKAGIRASTGCSEREDARQSGPSPQSATADFRNCGRPQLFDAVSRYLAEAGGCANVERVCANFGIARKVLLPLAVSRLVSSAAAAPRFCCATSMQAVRLCSKIRQRVLCSAPGEAGTQDGSSHN